MSEFSLKLLNLAGRRLRLLLKCRIEIRMSLYYNHLEPETFPEPCVSAMRGIIV